MKLKYVSGVKNHQIHSKQKKYRSVIKRKNRKKCCFPFKKGKTEKNRFPL